ncbi:metallophosphoesterase family protein [Candidatus Woesearchaeota archaeon]|nr:metallophosphoesterase family protein [Candidatus Woesearchaeota archaeon]
MTQTYGVISDMHAAPPQMVRAAFHVLQKKGVDAVVYNGDSFGERSGISPQDYFSAVLRIAGDSGLETYVVAGSHEEVQVFEPVLEYFGKKFSNILNTFKHAKIETPDHHLVFLNGSDWRAGDAVNHGYALQDEFNSGIYSNEGAQIRMIHMNDLRKMVSEPERTIVFSHVPRKFSAEQGVDIAEFGEATVPFMIGEHTVGVGSVFPGPVAVQLRRQGAPIALKRENRGNEVLTKLYEELGVTKSITGHFHESAHHAHDSKGNAIPERVFSQELFYNASCLDRLLVGKITVSDAEVAYQNINLKDHMIV